MPINTANTGAAIAAYRQRMNMSQQGLAGLMNVTHQAVSKWEKGLALPDTETLLALAKLFGTSMEDLLMGRLPKEPEPEVTEEAANAEGPAPAQEEPAEPAAEPVQAAGLGDLDFSSVMNMLPFVSTKVADRLFRAYAESSQPDAGKLSTIAPFVSTRALNDYLLAHPLADYSPEMLCGLAPFLPTATVDALILGLDEPISPHMIHTLMPFASAKVVDQMVLGKLGIQWDEDNTDSKGESESNFPGQQLQDWIHQKIRRKLDSLDMNKIQQQINQKLDLKTSSHPLSADARRAAAANAEPASRSKRESPRMRLIRKAIENDDEEMIGELMDELSSDEQQSLVRLLLEENMYDLLTELFDELDDEARRMLLAELTETGDAQLLTLFCEAAAELDPNAQTTLVQLLIKGRMYSELAEIIDELDEDVQHELLDRAFEINDPELLHLISEHL